MIFHSSLSHFLFLVLNFLSFSIHRGPNDTWYYNKLIKKRAECKGDAEMVDSNNINKLESHHKGRVMDTAFGKRINGRQDSNFAQISIQHDFWGIKHGWDKTIMFLLPRNPGHNPSIKQTESQTSRNLQKLCWEDHTCVILQTRCAQVWVRKKLDFFSRFCTTLCPQVLSHS